MQLLSGLGFELIVDPPHIDEDAHPRERPAALVLRLAREKARAVASRHRTLVTLAADTSVVLGARVLGKPADEAEAAKMLRSLSGAEHRVMTGVCAIGPAGERSTVVTTRVRFKPLLDTEIAWYIATGEPLDKAGAYGIQERAGAFVEAIDGSYTNVVGLPLAESLRLLEEVGQPLPWEEEGG